jgi:cold shock CspA family protein
MAQGTIKTLHAARGFGFIAADGESSDLYFQRSNVQADAFGALQVGQRVDFVTVSDGAKPDRLRADQVRPAEAHHPTSDPRGA